MNVIEVVINNSLITLSMPPLVMFVIKFLFIWVSMHVAIAAEQRLLRRRASRMRRHSRWPRLTCSPLTPSDWAWLSTSLSSTTRSSTPLTGPVSWLSRYSVLQLLSLVSLYYPGPLSCSFNSIIYFMLYCITVSLHQFEYSV